MSDPTLILHNGRIYTVNPDQPWATAVAIQDAHITAVGSDDEILALAGPLTRKLDLGGRLMLPGLCDAHIHFYDWSLSRRLVDLTGCADKAEMVARVAARAEQTAAGKWVVGRSWNEIGWRERELPTRDDLDPVTGDRPAVFWRSDMHSAVANSAALKLAGLEDESVDPEGGKLGRDGDGRLNGRLNGLLYELAINPVRQLIPNPTELELDEALREATAVLHQWGITALHDQRMKDHQDGPIALAAYQRLRQRGQLRQRVNCNIAAHDIPRLPEFQRQIGAGDDYLRLGHVKLFSDGAMGSRTAWLLDPYVGEPHNYGLSVTPEPQMGSEIRQAAELGFPASIHAIGDRAVRGLLDIFDDLKTIAPPTAVPHRIEHVQIIHPDDIPRLAELNLTASVQPIHATDDIDTADLVLGERASRAYNFRSLLTSGALLALGSDAPVANANPFLGFHAAIYRQRPERSCLPPWYPDERLTLEETIFGYTLGAAQAGGWQESIGAVVPGKRADLILLDRDLFALAERGVQGTDIAETQVLLTIFDGEIVYQAKGQ